VRVLALSALLAVALLAGCAAPAAEPSSSSPSEATSLGPSSPATTTTGSDGFCGPPQCSPCPPEQYLHVDLATDSDAGLPTVQWSQAPAANRTAEIQGYIDQGHAKGHVAAELPEANLTRIFGNLHDAYAAENPGTHPLGGRDPVVVDDGQGRLRFGSSVVVC